MVKQFGWRKPSQPSPKRKIPPSALKKFLNNETVSLILLRQRAKLNTIEAEENEKTTEAIQNAEKKFAFELTLLVEETARDVKILSAIATIKADQADNTFYPYQPHRSHLTTRFAMLFYNDRIVIHEVMRTSVVAMLHHGHGAADKMEKASEAFWWPGVYLELQEKSESCPSCRAAGKNLKTQIHSTEVNRLKFLTERNQSNPKDAAMYVF